MVILYSNSQAGLVQLICQVLFHPGRVTDSGESTLDGLYMFLVNKRLGFYSLIFLLSVKVGLRLVSAGQ